MIFNDLEEYENGNCIVSNTMISSSDFTDCDISVYVILRTIFFNPLKVKSIFSLRDFYMLFNMTQSKTKKMIYDSIVHLKNSKYIEVYDYFGNSIEFENNSNITYKISFTDIEVLEGVDYTGFSIVPNIHIAIILNYLNNNKIDRYKFIRYYLIIARCCSNSQRFGSIPMNKIKKIIKITNDTCKIFNMILQNNLEIIFYNNEYGYYDKNGNPKISSTMFGQKDVVMDYNKEKHIMTYDEFESNVKANVSSYNWIHIDKKILSNKKSESMKRYWENKRNGVDC